VPLFAVTLEDMVTNVIADHPAVPGGVVLEMMGLQVFVTKAAFDHERVIKPVSFAPLTRDQVIDARPLPGPGRLELGFRGGTAIVTGNFNTDTNRIEVDFFSPPVTDPVREPKPMIILGPAENVLGGAITAISDGKTLQVNGVDAAVLPGEAAGGDARLPQLEPRNAFGIPIDLTKVPRTIDVPIAGGAAMAPPLATINGYFAVPAKPVEGVAPTGFQGYDVVVDTDDRRVLIDPLKPQVAVTKAQARQRPGAPTYDIDLQGGLSVEIGPPGMAPTRLANPQRVEVRRVDRDPATGAWVEQPVALGVDGAVRVVAGKPFSRWRIRATLPVLPAPFDHPPMKVRAYATSPDAIIANGGTAPVSPDGEERVEWIKG